MTHTTMHPTNNSAALSDREIQFVMFIHGYLAQHRCAPTLGELQEEFRAGHGTVQYTIDCLVAKGLIWKVPAVKRNIRLWFQRRAAA